MLSQAQGRVPAYGARLGSAGIIQKPNRFSSLWFRSDYHREIRIIYAKGDGFLTSFEMIRGEQLPQTFVTAAIKPISLSE